MGQAMDAFVADWEWENGNTVKCLEAMPDGKLDMAPHEKSMTLHRLAWHLCEAERWFVAEALGVEVPGENPVPRENPAPNVAAVVAARKASHASLVSAVRRKDDAWLAEKVEFLGMNVPRRSALDIMIRHEVHHRGQLSVYLRLASVNVPSVYGPSADDPGGR